MKDDSSAIIVWGTQLSIEHQSALAEAPHAPVILIESRGMCQKFSYHKQKLVFVLTAMREYADELRATGREVEYHELETSPDHWFETLDLACRERGITRLLAMRQNDRAPQRQLEAWCRQHQIDLQVTPNCQFLTPTHEFNVWAEGQKQLLFETFYRWQRKRLGILMDGEKPVGGTWNFDHENRKPLPKGAVVALPTFPESSKHRQHVIELVERNFPTHPGSLETPWLPTTRDQARTWLEEFIEQRLPSFGAYEDAMADGQPFLYHSALSALLNIGLLHAQDIIDRVESAPVPMASKEGFIRQLIGWREYMFGLYHFKPRSWKDQNYLSHIKQLEPWWWQLQDAPEPPLQGVLETVRKYGYSHHIERLMVVGNYMLLDGIHPRQVYDWFMSMYVDAYEWVMVPNIFGMSQYADGGIDHGGFATKPYISGSNYLQKMGRWWPSAQAATTSRWTPMYWEFFAPA